MYDSENKNWGWDKHSDSHKAQHVDHGSSRTIPTARGEAAECIESKPLLSTHISLQGSAHMCAQNLMNRKRHIMAYVSQAEEAYQPRNSPMSSHFHLDRR